jgi:hypothetical protein
VLQYYRNRKEILDTNFHELFFRQRDKKRKDVRELRELDELNKLEIKDKDFLGLETR